MSLYKKNIITDNAPKAIGTYSQGITFNNLVFTSGQIPINPNTGKIVDTNFRAEVCQVLDNLAAILSSGGSSLRSVIKLTVFLVDLDKFSILNKVFEKYFPDNPPCRSVVQVAALPMNVNIEIDAISIVE